MIDAKDKKGQFEKIKHAHILNVMPEVVVSFGKKKIKIEVRKIIAKVWLADDKPAIMNNLT